MSKLDRYEEQENIEFQKIENTNIEYQIIDLLSEEAYQWCDERNEVIHWIIGGDLIYDSVLTESLCRVCKMNC